MAIRTENDPRFYRRFWIMGTIAIGYALWSLYDGAIGYPAKQQRALAHKKLEDEFASDAAVFSEKWRAYASERGWSTKYPGPPKSEEDYKGSIVMQYVMFVGAGLIGLWLISLPLRGRGRWIEASDTGLTSSWGQSLDYENIVRLDKFRWRSKGIAKITYHDGKRKRRFVLDNYKFDRHTTDAILYEIEQRIDPALITGGPPEPPPQESHDEVEAATESVDAAE
jgi:hypothetical protein